VIHTSRRLLCIFP